jgi:hypothetical protein
MSDYTPHRWVLLEISRPDQPTIQKLFGGWYGGYTQSDSWKLNSGVTNIRVEGKHYEFDGQSGSTYYCNANDYGMTSYMHQVLESWRRKLPHVNFREIALETIEAVVV